MSETTTYDIRAAGPDDFDDLRALYKLVWGYNRPEVFDRWRYTCNGTTWSPIALADREGLLGGAYILWPAMLRVGGERVAGAQSMDTMTHPDFRGQGVFTNLADACFRQAAEAGIDLLYGFPNPLSYPGFVRKLGWTHIGDVTHWVRVLTPSKHPKVRRYATPLGGGILDAATGLLPAGSARGFEIGHTKPDATAMVPLLDALKDQAGACRVDRSADWLSWRYAAESCNDYRWVSAYRNGALSAVGIWGMRGAAWKTEADGRAHLVELIGDDPKAREAVVATIIREARAEKALLLETLCNIPDLSATLRRAGFYRHREAPFIVKSLRNASYDVDPLDHQNWRIFGGDVDTF
jgi:GNAT superfamily N-acetyltransferase